MLNTKINEIFVTKCQPDVTEICERDTRCVNRVKIPFLIKSFVANKTIKYIFCHALFERKMYFYFHAKM